MFEISNQPNQAADALLMIRPEDFEYNSQTASDNEFQNKSVHTNESVRGLVNQEFAESVRLLRQAGVRVLVYEKQPELPKLPDAVFPNNWISTTPEGNLIVYPMLAQNRQAETLQLNGIQELLEREGFRINSIIDWQKISSGLPLEGTGSMIIDWLQRRIFACLSKRTNLNQVHHYCRYFGFEPVIFQTASQNGLPFYHTNVVMSLASNIAIICKEAIKSDSKTVLDMISKHRKVIEINLEQASKFFCANVLEVRTQTGGSVLVMSETAKKGFTANQLKIIEDSIAIVALPIDTIEQIGGGSARCMMAEIFLPLK